MSEADDSWPMPKYSSASSAHLHALGVVTLNFNNFEFSLFRLYAHHLERMKIDLRVAWNIYSSLQDDTKTKVIIHIFSIYESNSQVVEHITHLINFFNRCKTNRNILLHATLDVIAQPPADFA